MYNTTNEVPVHLGIYDNKKSKGSQDPKIIEGKCKSDLDIKESLIENTVKNSKISSSMKFYLFKKKFQKKIQTSINYTNVLSPEKFILNKK